MTEAHGRDRGIHALGSPAVTRPGRRRWQVGLPTLLLLMAAIAVWMTFFINRRQIARLEARIQALLPLVHELVVDDPAKIAVVKLEDYWYDDNRWEVYLPPGDVPALPGDPRDRRSGLALRDEEACRSRRAGMSCLWSNGWSKDSPTHHRRTCDGKEQLTVEEPKEWDTGSSSSNGTGRRDQSSVPGRSARRPAPPPLHAPRRPGEFDHTVGSDRWHLAVDRTHGGTEGGTVNREKGVRMCES